MVCDRFEYTWICVVGCDSYFTFSEVWNWVRKLLVYSKKWNVLRQLLYFSEEWNRVARA